MVSTIQRKGFWVLLIAVFLGMAQGASADFRPARGLKAEGEYIVVFKGAPAKSVKAVRSKALGLAASHGAEVKRAWESAINGALFTRLSAAQARALAKDPQVAWVEENGIVHTTATQSSPPWGLDRIDQQKWSLSGSYNYPFDGSGVNIYVLDTGILETHDDFGDRASRDFDAREDGQNGADCNGHGTHVAGTAGGSTYGVAKAARLRSVRVLDCEGRGTWADVIEGVNWVMNNAQFPAVANMSLGGPGNDATDTAVANAVNAGIFFAVSAGNENQDACTQSPARAAQAFAVGATNSFDSRAYFTNGASNWGACVDIFAPGLDVLSAWIGSDTATKTISGTSMATPHVAGVAALMLDEDPNLTPADIRARLIARSTPGEVNNAGTNSPNRLLYSLTLGAGGLPQMPAYLRVLPWMCNGYNDVSWTAADGATQYELYQSTSSSFTTETLVYVGTDTYYLANVSGTRYFRIRSCGPTGCSASRSGNRSAIKVNGCL